MNKNRIMVFLLIAIVVLFSVSCKGGESESSEAVTEVQAGSDGGSGSLDKDSYKFCVSMGWAENESARKFKEGWEAGFEEFFGKKAEVVWADAAYDGKKQSEQIEAFARMNPDAIFVTASDPASITPAVKKAVEAGVPVFAADSYLSGAGVTTTVMSNNFGMGESGAQYIASMLNERGNIAMIDLPANETWDMRTQGCLWGLKQYPGIEVVSSWSYDSAGSVSPRQAVDNILTANPKKGSIDAIWCAWDGAATEGALAIEAAGREDEMFTIGIDGGEQAFEYVKNTCMSMTFAQSCWEMSYMGVYYAKELLSGNKVPRIIASPVYIVTADMLDEIHDDYDHNNKAQMELGWKRDL